MRPCGAGIFAASHTRATVLTALALVVAVTPLHAQGSGQQLAPPVVHELRLTIPPLSRATLNPAIRTGNGVWASSVNAVTNVAIDILLLPPDLPGSTLSALRLTDADGVSRSWADGPVLVARALTPGRHTTAVRWDAPTLTDDVVTQALSSVRTFTRPAMAGSASKNGPPTEPGVLASAADEKVLLRIAPR